MRFGPFGFVETILLLLILMLPIWATVLTLRREDFSLANKVLLIAMSWLILFVGQFGLIGSILALAIIFSNKPAEQYRL